MQIVLDEPAVGPQGCALTGQEEGAAWVEEHPGWFLKGTRCTAGDKPEPQQDI
jgi:hypothetical protein